jgi:hypothetical protein
LRNNPAWRGKRPRANTVSVAAYVEEWRRYHEVSILIFGETGEGRCFGCCPRKKVSMMRMQLPQQGQGWSGAFDSSGLALTALMASIGMSGTASSSRIRADILDAGLAREPNRTSRTSRNRHD